MPWNVQEPLWVGVGLLLLCAGAGVMVRRRVAGGLPLVAAGLVALALAGMRVGDGEVVMVLDASASARGAPWRDRAWVRELARRHLGDGAAPAVVERARLEGFEDPLQRPRWVVTDGLAPVGNAEAWTVLPPTGVDAGVRELVVREGKGSVEVMGQVGWWGPAGEAAVTLLKDGHVVAARRVGFEGGGGAASARWIQFETELPAGACEFRMEVRAAGDAWPENDRGAAWYVPKEEGRVLVIKTGRETFKAEAQWQAVVVEEGAVLGDTQVRGLDRYVRQTGGGLLILGKPAGGLEGLSPVVGRELEGARRNVVFVLDASASMNEEAGGGGGERKFALLGRAVAGALRQLGADDRVAIVLFNGAGRLAAAGTRDEVLAQLDAKMMAERPAGPTVPDAALALITAQLAGEAREKWVVVVTDGEIAGGAMTAERWVQGLGGAKLMAMAPGREGALAAVLKAVPGAVFVPVAQAEGWSAALEGLLAERVDGRWRAEGSAWTGRGELAGQTGRTPRWREVWRKPEAVVWAEGDAQQVLAATVQRGLGRVAAVAADDAALRQQAVEHILAPAGDRRFVVSAVHDGNAWRVRADGAEEGKFLDAEALSLREVGSEQVVAMEQSGPGRYEARIPASGALRAVVTRATSAGESLVGRVTTAQVETTEWPATVGVVQLPREGVELKAAGESHERWTPRGGKSWDLSPWCLALGAAAAVGALWLRR